LFRWIFYSFWIEKEYLHLIKGNTLSANPKAADAADGEKAPAKSKKLLIIVGALVVVLALAGVGAFIFISKQRAAHDGDGEPAASEPVKVAHVVSKTPPVYLPLDSMVVNLADPGGERVAQVGITLEVIDAKASESVKAFLPTIRSGVLMLISQRTAEELLKSEGKEKLAEAILREANVPFGGSAEPEEEETKNSKSKRRVVQIQYPVVGVLFSSFIVQ
jgi:flagellar FliL protein